MARRCLILIPARYASTRFPGKPLCKILGKSMIQTVYENCIELNQFDEINFSLAVVTDDQRIEDHIKQFGGNVVRVDDNVPSGSERISLAYERFFKQESYDLIVNVQGDEPLLKAGDIYNLAKFHLGTDFDIATMVVKQSDQFEEFRSINRVKAVFVEQSGKCLYFSREAVPYRKDKDQREWFLHVGVYSYKTKKLKEFSNCKRGYLEQLENLEQLRALENGMTIGAILIDERILGIDTIEDLKKIEGVLSGKTE